MYALGATGAMMDACGDIWALGVRVIDPLEFIISELSNIVLTIWTLRLPLISLMLIIQAYLRIVCNILEACHSMKFL